MADTDNCSSWYKGDPILETYHAEEWCKVSHDDCYQFEMLCLEGASVGLSWKTIMHKRATYRAAFHNFDIKRCAAMTDNELETILATCNIIRNRGKVFSVRSNARAVKQIQAEFGSFDTYLWQFTEGQVIDGRWTSLQQVPTVSDISRQLSADMKRRGIAFVGPVITYSFMQSIGMVNDHLCGCDCR